VGSPLWKNYTKFLAISLPLVSKEVKTEAFIEQFTLFLFASSFTEEVQTILEVMADVPLGKRIFLENSYCVEPCELFVKSIETEREKRWKDKKKKKKDDFYIQENILAFYAKLAAKAAPYYYDSSDYFMRALRELVFYCVTNSQTISSFHSLIRTSIIEILDRFIFLEGKEFSWKFLNA
jgi:hypothetical protein